MAAPLSNIRVQIKEEYRKVLKKASQGGGYAQCLQNIMRNGTNGPVAAAYANCASQYEISKKLSELW